MSDERDLKLNSLARYAKRSPGLVLEEYGHCEVPAGCGGAVLRWFDPGEALPLTVWLYAPSPVECWLDGAPLASNRVLVGHGAHAVALRVERVTRGEGALVFAARYAEADEARASAPRRSRAVGRTATLLSRGDGAWRGTHARPDGDAWRYEGFDDAAWSPLTELALPAPGERSGGAWRYAEATKQGGRAVGLADAAGALWVRRRFELILQGSEETEVVR